MKTAEEILYDFESPRVDYAETLFTAKDCLNAMRLYANAKLDEAKFNVSLRETNIYTTPDIDTGFAQGIEAAIESIEQLKDDIQ